MQRFAARTGSNAIKRQSPTIKLSAYFSASSNTNSNTNSTNNYTKGDGSGDTSILREENDDREFYKGIPIGPPSDLEYPESTPHERYQAKKQKKLDDKVYNTENRYKLKGVLRKESGINNRTAGSKVSRRLRREGLIPGIIYGNDVQGFGKGADHPLNKTIEVVVKHTDIQAELRAHKNVFESRVYELEIEGSAEKFTVLPRHCELHPVQNQVMNCNFLRYWPGRVVSIPLKYVNQELSPALKRGAFVLAQNRFVDCVIEEGVELPEFIEVDCSELKLKQTVRLDRLRKPEGVNWGAKVKQNFLVGSVFGRAANMEENEDDP